MKSEVSCLFNGIKVYKQYLPTLNTDMGFTAIQFQSGHVSLPRTVDVCANYDKKPRTVPVADKL